MEEYIALCNEKGQITGYEEKLKVHQEGWLHLAFSIIIWNNKGEMLLQKRADHKYHSAGLWTNTCCGHPNINESLQEAAGRRLYEEMGFSCTLMHKFDFCYTTKFEDGLIENERDAVFYGNYDGEIHANPDEVSNYKWLSLDTLSEEIKHHPELFTVWFKAIVSKIAEKAS